LALIALGICFYQLHKEEIKSFIKNHFTNWNFNILSTNISNNSRELVILAASIAIVSTIVYYIQKHFKDQQKIIDDSAKEMHDYILSILEFRNEEGLRYPDIEVEDFSDHYAKEKNIPQSLLVKILSKLNETFEEKNSEIVKTTFYLDGKIKSFWKLKSDCLQDFSDC